MDGTPNRQGEVTKVAIMNVKGDNLQKTHRFLVADIGEDNLILGYPFFEDINPRIDWPTGVMMKPVTLIPLDEAAYANKTTIAQQLAEQATDKKDRTWQEQVSHRYHKHGKVFSEQASERFPGKRPWDHAINLKPDAPDSIDCRVYLLAPKEREDQRKFLEANLRLHRIRQSKSQ